MLPFSSRVETLDSHAPRLARRTTEDRGDDDNGDIRLPMTAGVRWRCGGELQLMEVLQMSLISVVVALYTHYIVNEGRVFDATAVHAFH